MSAMLFGDDGEPIGSITDVIRALHDEGPDWVDDLIHDLLTERPTVHQPKQVAWWFPALAAIAVMVTAAILGLIAFALITSVTRA